MHRIKVAFFNKSITGMMQSADVFEKFKVAVEFVLIFRVDGIEMNQEVFNEFVETGRTFCANEIYGMAAAVSMDGTYEWHDPTIKVVSNGHNWFTIEEYIGMLKSGSNWPTQL